MTRTYLTRIGIAVSGLVLLLASALPSVSAQEMALPTPRFTLGASSGGVATAAALATKTVGTASALATKTVATTSALATKGAQLKLTLTPFATTGSAAAKTAITDYASSVLGIGVTVRYAGGLTGDVTRTITQTPKGSTAQAYTAKLAVISYGATLSNGAAALSYGSGTVTGSVQVDVQGSSLGVYSLLKTYSGTLTATSALTLAKQTFPALASFPYASQVVSKGYAWYGRTTVTGYDVKTKKFTSMAETVILYVLPSATGKATVTATVGRGDYAAAVKP